MPNRPLDSQQTLDPATVSSEPDASRSGLYATVTNHWPRIATGLVVMLGVAEFVLGGLTSDSGLELLLVTWAGTTGGVWFLFEKAEKSVSPDFRERVAARLMRADVSEKVASLPEQFIGLFDGVFGERHLSWRCFRRSSVASLFAVAATAPFVYMVGQVGGPMVVGRPGFGWEVGLLAPTLLGAAVLVNLIPDYLSLLETRWLMRFAARTGWVLLALTLDFIVTTGIAIATWAMVGMRAYVAVSDNAAGSWTPALDDLWALVLILGLLSTYFTSVWLWLYGLTVPMSRLLLKMNSGVGFLLRVTDVERQPLRSLGFVGVILVSLFFVGLLPLVLL